MASATAPHRPFRVVSRRAQLLLQRHWEGRGGAPRSGGAASKSAPKKDETPWPKSLRYTFYTVCVASVPFSIGQAIALSPKLRDYMLGDDVEEADDESGGFSAREIISLVRNYWGHEDYVAPIDRPKLKHADPGHRNEWQEDNYSSFLDMFGMYTPKESSGCDTSDMSEETAIPMSLDNEPPSNVRNDQTILLQYLSSKTNPSGIKARLSLIPCKSDGMEDEIDSAGYDTECTLPGNASMNTLRALCQGSDAQSLRRDLAESDPNFVSKSTNERIRTKSWDEDCRWVVSFSDSEECDKGTAITMGGDVDDDVAQISVFGGASFDSAQEDKPSTDASNELRQNTAIHSSWSYFPESAVNAPTATHLGSTGSVSAAASASAPNAQSSSMTTTAANESLQVQRLEHQIATLEAELKDPSSLRDRDDMYEELRLARRELRSLKPWWRRFW